MSSDQNPQLRMSHFKDPYTPTSIMDCHVMVLLLPFVGVCFCCLPGLDPCEVAGSPADDAGSGNPNKWKVGRKSIQQRDEGPSCSKDAKLTERNWMFLQKITKWMYCCLFLRWRDVDLSNVCVDVGCCFGNYSLQNFSNQKCWWRLWDGYEPAVQRFSYSSNVPNLKGQSVNHLKWYIFFYIP